MLLGVIGPPSLDKSGHVGRQIGCKEHLLAGARVYEAQSPRMQSLTRTHFETVVYECFVLGRGHTAQNDIAAIAGVVEKRMADVAHMDSYLMSATGLEHASDQ